jgi:hypothetical protein
MCLADELRFFMMHCSGFVPAFEKIGKTCHIYLTPVHFILLHNVLNSDGVQAIAQFSKVACRFALGLPNLGGFELYISIMHGELCQYTLVFVSPFYLSILQVIFFFHSFLHSIEVTLQETVFDEYRISSQNEDRIAFTVDLTLLSRALKSSVSIYGDKLQVKLVRKRPSLSERPMPYLTFESKVRL